MPGSKFLQWTEIKEFTPGLWTQDLWNMPASAAQQMDDCAPDLGTGLRASMKGVPFVITGLPANANTSVVGLYTVGGKGATGSQCNRYLILLNGTNIQVWRFYDATDVAWTQIGANIPNGGTGPNGIVFDTFVDSGGLEYVMFNLFQTAAQDGVWSINVAANTITNRLAGTCTCLAVQDDRIIAAQGPTLRWTDSQSVSSWPAANNLPVQRSRQSPNIVTMAAQAPSDLILGLQQAPWVLVQGDISNPVVRGMSDARVPGGIAKMPQTASGRAFVSQNRGLYLTNDGSSFTSISDQLNVNNWQRLNLGYCTDMLVTSKGLLWDERTKAWSRLSQMGSLNCHVIGAQASNEIMTATYTASTAQLFTFDTTESARSTTWTWKSAPFRDPSGRQIRVREIQTYARSFNGISTLTVTVGGTVAAVVTLPANQGSQSRFLFDRFDETLDVTISAASNGTAEAPTLEVVRVGTLPQHQLR